ncbi:BatD family protein, partial [Bacteroidota bacterium]
SGISGSKIFEYLLIPKHEGEYKIEPVHFSYFDLGKKDYVSLTSKEFIINVAQGEDGETSVISGVQKEDIQFLGKDIRFIKNSGEIKNSYTKLFGSLKFVILSIAPLFIFLFIILYKRKRDELEGNQMLLKNKRATKVARKRLFTAKKYLTQTDQEKFYEEISKALWGYISDKLSIPVAELTKDTTSIALKKRNITDELVDKYLDTIDNSEFARFAPSSGESGMEKTYNDAVSVITSLEGVLK